MKKNTYTQREIAEMIDVPQCNVSQALRKVDPVGPLFRPYRYNIEDALNALAVFYTKRRDRANERVKRFDDKVVRIIDLRNKMLHGIKEGDGDEL